MEHRPLGRTGVSVSKLCLGAMMFGDWDTADIYSQGESEMIVGKDLAGGRRDDVVLASKAWGPMGEDPNRRGTSRGWIIREVEDSTRGAAARGAISGPADPAPVAAGHRLPRSITVAVVRIDHVIYGAADLDVAATRVEACLGLTALAGGRHEGLGTHNRLVPLADGSFIELLAVADPQEARRSPLGAALRDAIAVDDGLLGWAVALDDVGLVAARLGIAITTVGRQGMTARLTGVLEALSEPFLPFFIERAPGRIGGRPAVPVANATARITWLEVAGDARRLSEWLGGAELPVRVVDGPTGVRAVGVGERELRSP